MTVPWRWPLHPPPGPLEALSSWLDRLAAAYGLSREALLGHNLGPASALADVAADGLDWDPPTVVIDALAERTGIGRHELRAMTIAGWVPWLLDTLESSEDPAVFDTYVRQYSVLLAPGAAKRREVHRWRPWLPVKSMRRDCPECATDPDRGYTLMSQLPIMISCPEHGCQLESPITIALAALQHQKVSPRPVTAQIMTMDRRSHEGLVAGMVTLPRRQVHVGVWFRLLRTLLDEVNTPLSQLGARSKDALLQIWLTAGRPVRAGLTVWRPYEQLDWPHQQAMLEAAAAALHLIEGDALIACGSLGPLLTSEPPLTVPAGDPPVHDGGGQLTDAASYWQRAREQLDAAIEAARTGPDAAHQMFTMLTFAARSAASFEHARRTLLEVGVPSEFLPSHHQLAGADLG